MKKTTYGPGENIYKWCDQQGLNFQNKQTVHKAQLKKKNNNNKKNPIKNWAGRHFSKEDVQDRQEAHEKILSITN